MKLIIPLLFAILFALPFSISSQSQSKANPSARITVVGVVYCDTCSSNTFSRHSYFLPGAEVHIQCKFKVSSPKTSEEINISVNRTTDKLGVYNLQIPNIDGVNCVDGLTMSSLCEAKLINSRALSCNIPNVKLSTNEISVKSKQDNLCIYSLSALSYKPAKQNAAVCEKNEISTSSNLNDSKFFWPFFPPYGFTWPPLPFTTPPPSFPFPTLPYPPLPFTGAPPSLPFPFPSSPPSFPFPTLPFPPLPFTGAPPSLPFPFPSVPPLFHSPPPPPAFDWTDPKTWVPGFPPTKNVQNVKP